MKVGLIVNPMASEDIRRLTAYGIAYNNAQKASLAMEVILGADSMNVDEIMIMPEMAGIARMISETMTSKVNCRLNVLDFMVTNTPEDSIRATETMRKSGVGCIVVIGGDGTNRVVAKKCEKVPILPLAAGTNNVIPYLMEGTVAGMVAGYIARGGFGKKCLYRAKRIEIIKDGEFRDFALVDAVVVDQIFVGSRAIWSMKNIKQIVAAICDPSRIGMSSIPAVLQHVDRKDEKRAIYVKIGGGKLKVKAPIAPGIVDTIKIEEYRILNLNDEVIVEVTPCLIAVDGEREVYIHKGEHVKMRLTNNGPWIVDVEETLKEIIQKDSFTKFKQTFS